MELIKGSLINIFRKRTRSFITIIGIIIGVCSVIIINSVSNIGRVSIVNELNSLGISGISVTPSGDSQDAYLTSEELEIIKNLDCVKSAVPVMTKYINVEVRKEITECVVWGIDTGVNQVFNMELLHGRLLRKDDISQSKRVCVVDNVFAEKTYARTNIVGKVVNLKIGEVWDNYEVVGVVSSGGMLTQGILNNFAPYFVYIPYSSLQVQSNYVGFTQIAVKIKDNISSLNGQSEIISAIEKSGNKGQFTTTDLSDKKQSIDDIISLISIVLSIIAGISLVVSGLTIMIVMMSSINERTREIGIKKAIGAKRRTIAFEFLIEAVFISGFGGILGCMLGVFIVGTGCFIFGIPLSIDVSSLLFCLGFAVLLGGIFGVYPAVKASKLAPVDAFLS